MALRPGHALPGWPVAVAVVAHPDDETFGLGAILDRMSTGGTAVHVICFTRGEASTLSDHGADLRKARAEELGLASKELGVSGVTLLDYPDGGLSAVPAAELAAHVTALADSVQANGLLVFDETGVTGHCDHQAATRAAVLAGRRSGLPVLAWTLPAPIAGQLSAETGQLFAGQLPSEIDICTRVSRTRQRRAALLHQTQISPGAVLWRRLQLQADCEHLRWLVWPA